jgi:hypothetical protein
MRSMFALLLMSTAISTATGVGAQTQWFVANHSDVTTQNEAAPSAALTQVSDDDSWFWPASNGGSSDATNGGGSDDGNGGGSDDCEEGGEGDDACGLGASGNAAPAGTVAPPSNGLFSNGTAPKAITN